MSRRDEIIEKINTVVTLPAAASEVARLIQDENVSISEVAKTIEYDPGLTSNLLRLVNSAEICGIKEISSIRNAVVRLGMVRLFHLVVVSAISPIVQKPVKGYDLSAGELWNHSIAVAIGVDKLAQSLKINTPDYAFTAGLLHDVGKIVLGTFVEVDVEPILKISFEEGIPFDQAEERVFGINHAEVGAVLLEKWGLPADIVSVTRWHHDIDSCSGEKTVAELVHVSDGISIMFGVGVRRDGLNYYLSRDVISRLSIKNNIIETVACQTMSSLEDVREFLSGNNNGSEK
jgi:putative nucleotidyltransferase with HDIG domain